MAVALLGLWQPVGAEADPKTKTDLKAAKATPADLLGTLNAIAEAQRMLAAEIGQLRDQIKEVERGIADARDDLRQKHDADQALMDLAKGMREEVRGLYVESSGLKGDIAQVGKQVEALDGNLGNFRLSAGFVVAAVIVLQIVLVGLMFRQRG